MKRKIIAQYKNGNYNVMLYNDGTKIRFNNENYMEAEFPESIDCKISNRCDMGCPMCHEQSVPNGALANLNHPIFDSLHAGTELALGGGNVLEHTGLEDFLMRMRDQGVICNMTIHLDHFIRKFETIQDYVNSNLIHGVGVSINTPIPDEVINYLVRVPNLVVHVIAGIVPWETLVKLSNNNIKLLILGYKTWGRGIQYAENHNEIQQNIHTLETRLPYLMEHFALVSFDNLALEQLHMRDHVSDEEWERCYMGDDGTHTMYLDMVEEKYAVSSVSTREPIFSNDIRVLFASVRRRKNCILKKYND